MDVLLIPFGSAGDVLPHVWLGRGLRARGHNVALVANGYFAPLVHRAGLELIEVGSAAAYRAALDDPDLADPRRGFAALARHGLIPALRPVYDAIAARHRPGGGTVVAAAGLALGARVARDRLGVPLATVHLQPTVFRSLDATPRVPGLPFAHRLPRPLKRALFRLVDAGIDRTLAPALDSFRAELGLPPVRRVLAGWIHSPDLVLGLFPPWFAPPQPEWPPNTVLTGFPLYDAAEVEPVSPEAERFLAEGEPPIVATPGSGAVHSRAFFAAVAEGCRLLGRRGVLLTRFPEQIPAALPTGVRHLPYVPLSRLAPRAAALVHHGGIGTLAQGLAAGIPQLVMPATADQPDNAARLARLGVGASLPPHAFHAAAVARALDRLLRDEAVATRCREVAAMAGDGRDALEAACTAIERLGAAAAAETGTGSDADAGRATAAVTLSVPEPGQDRGGASAAAPARERPS